MDVRSEKRHCALVDMKFERRTADWFTHLPIERNSYENADMVHTFLDAVIRYRPAHAWLRRNQ
jgi:hypothetical protein